MVLHKEELKKYLPLVIVASLLVISFLIIKDYIIPIITAFILSYLILPVHKKLSKNIPEKFSAVISIIIVLLIILIPLTGIISGVISHSYDFLDSESLNNFMQKISKSKLIERLGIDLGELTNKAVQLIISLLTDLTTSIASALLAFLIITLSMYYFLTDWNKFTSSVIKYFPFRNKKKVSKNISKITKNLIYGTFLIAIFEFVIASLGFWIAGIKPFFLLSIVTGLFAFIPALGPAIVWIPLFIIVLLQKKIFMAIIVLITGLIMSIYIDTILRAKITGKKTGIHPIIVLIGIIGGVTVLGIAGFIIGPLILTYTIQLLEDLIED